jgi:hypothetical protein
VTRTFRRCCTFLLAAVAVSLAIPSVAFSVGNRSFNSVTFAENDSGADSITVGEQSSSPKALILFAALSPAFTNPGYTFVGWNTLSAGGTGGISYFDGETYDFSTPLVLYAQWTGNSYTLSYNPEGGVVSSPTVSFTVGSSPLTLLTPTESGFVFLGWNSAANGSGTSYTGGSAYTPTSNVSLYAQWSTLPSGTITFASNGASGTIAPIVGSVGSSITLPSGDALTYPGYSFVDWNTSAAGGGSSYLGGSSLVVSSSFTLYAQWTLVQNLTITFSSNGGVGTVAPLSAANGASLTMPGGTGLSFVGHTFSNWNSKEDGSGTTFNVNEPLLINTSMTLFAQWDAMLISKSPIVLIGAVGSFTNNSATLTPNIRTQVLRLALLTKSGHFKSETLYGYSNSSGSVSSQLAISRRRAIVVAAYLRAELRSIHVSGVTVTSAGEGTVTSQSGSVNRVEVFVKG